MFLDDPRGGLLPITAVRIGLLASRPRFDATVATATIGTFVVVSVDELGVASVAALADVIVGVDDIGTSESLGYDYGVDNL